MIIDLFKMLHTVRLIATQQLNKNEQSQSLNFA